MSASYVSLPSGYLTNALPEDGRPLDLDFVKAYEDTSTEVKEWGLFESSDIERNGIRMSRRNRTPVPGFVAKFERELDSKPGLAASLALDVCCFLDYPFDADGSV